MAAARRTERVELVASSLEELKIAVDRQILKETLSDPIDKTDRRVGMVRMGYPDDVREERADDRAHVIGAGRLPWGVIHTAADARGTLRNSLARLNAPFNCLFVLLDFVVLEGFARIRYDLAHEVLPANIRDIVRWHPADPELYVGTVAAQHAEALYRLLNGKPNVVAPPRRSQEWLDIHDEVLRHREYSVSHGSIENVLPAVGTRDAFLEALCYGFGDTQRRPSTERDRMWRELPTLIRSDPFPLGYRGTEPRTELLAILCRLKPPGSWFRGAFKLKEDVARTFMPDSLVGNADHWASHIEAFLLQRMAILATVDYVYREVVGGSGAGPWHIQLSVWCTAFGEPTDADLSTHVTGGLRARPNRWALAVVHAMFYGVHRTALKYVDEATTTLGIPRRAWYEEKRDVLRLVPGSDGTGGPTRKPTGEPEDNDAAPNETVRQRDARRAKRRKALIDAQPAGHSGRVTPLSKQFALIMENGAAKGRAAAANARKRMPPEEYDGGAAAGADAGVAPMAIEEGGAAAAAAPARESSADALARLADDAGIVPRPAGQIDERSIGPVARAHMEGQRYQPINFDLGSAPTELLRPPTPSVRSGPIETIHVDIQSMGSLSSARKRVGIRPVLASVALSSSSGASRRREALPEGAPMIGISTASPARPPAPAPGQHSVSIAAPSPMRTESVAPHTDDEDGGGPGEVRSARGRVPARSAEESAAAEQRRAHERELGLATLRIRALEGQRTVFAIGLAKVQGSGAVAAAERARLAQKEADARAELAAWHARRDAAKVALGLPVDGAPAAREEEDEETPEAKAHREEQELAAQRLRQQEHEAAVEEERKRDEAARAAAAEEAARVAAAEEAERQRQEAEAKAAEAQGAGAMDLGDIGQPEVEQEPVFDIMEQDNAEEKEEAAEPEAEAAPELVQDKDGFFIPAPVRPRRTTAPSQWSTTRILFTPSRQKRMSAVFNVPQWTRGQPLPANDVNMGCVFHCALDDFPDLVVLFMKGLPMEPALRARFLGALRECRRGRPSSRAWTDGAIHSDLTVADLALMARVSELTGLYLWADIDDREMMRGTLVGPARLPTAQDEVSFEGLEQGNDLVPALRVQFLVAQMRRGPHKLAVLDRAIGVVYNTALGMKLDGESVTWKGAYGEVSRDEAAQSFVGRLPHSAQSDNAIPEKLSRSQFEPVRRWTFPGKLDVPDFWQYVFGHVAVAPLLDAAELAMCGRMAKMFGFLYTIQRRTDEASSRLLLHRMIEAQCADWFNAVVRVVEFQKDAGLRLELFHRALRSARPDDVADEKDRDVLDPKATEDNYRPWCNMLTKYVCCNVRGDWITPYNTIGYAHAHRELLMRPNGIRVSEADLPLLLEIVLPSIYTTCHVEAPDDPAGLAGRVVGGDVAALKTGKELADALTAWAQSVQIEARREGPTRKRGRAFVAYLSKPSAGWMGKKGHDWLVCRAAKNLNGTVYVDVACVSLMPAPSGKLTLRMTPVDRRSTPSRLALRPIDPFAYTDVDRYIPNPFVTDVPILADSIYGLPLTDADVDLQKWLAEEAGEEQPDFTNEAKARSAERKRQADAERVRRKRAAVREARFGMAPAAAAPAGDEAM